MLRSATDALRTRKFATATAVLVLAFALLIPCVAVLAASFASGAARTYLQAYRPVVYLRADADKKTAARLAKELDGWPAVDEATVRTPAQAFGDLERRLGRDEVAKLGVSAEMLPFSVELVPATPVIGHLDLIARVSGLQARPEVATVDVPSAKAARTLSFVRWLLILGAVSLVVMVAAGIGQTCGFLIRLARAHSRETELLASFGAPPAKLRRPTMVRGMAVGTLAGVVAFASLLVVLLLWQNARPVVLGLAHGLSGWSWAVIMCPVVLGPAAGALAGILANRTVTNTNKTDDLELQILVADS